MEHRPFFGYENMIALENITYRYADDIEPALRNVSLRILPGESVCMMGANGSGKSTFAKLTAGLIAPARGRLRVESDGAERMPVGIIFQNPDNQMVAATVEKEIAFALENLGCRQDEMEQRVGETLEKFGIPHLRNRLTSELSGGEKQRVALASVMIFQPNILILDEPDSFLDQEGKAALRQELQRIRQFKPSMVQIHITQYPQAAAGYDRLIVFHRGEVAADDNPDRIFRDRAFCLKTGLAFADDNAPQVRLPASRAAGQAVGKRVNRIEFKRVDFGYPGFGKVIGGLSTILEAGRITGVVGLSGAGKSTLGALVCGLLKPTDGEIKYVDDNGGRIDADAIAGHVSGIFQQPERQFFLPSCLEEIQYGPKNLGRSLQRDELVALFEMIGLDIDQFVDRDPFSLSGGEKRRMAFAAVLSISPDFIVFDEPTCGLDAEGTGRFLHLAQALKASGVGMIVISHDPEIIRSLADRVIVLRKGESSAVLGHNEFFSDPRYSSVIAPVSECDAEA
ncbi:MAG: ATP-binding cassette domain-containing protein [candidate division Zixibacteria bacterium]|nr:ATP-binding cassette domain-containing protein [candidate division Zixibacteria bacterium]